MTGLTERDVQAADIPDWRMFDGAIHARYETKSFAAGLAFVNEVGAAAEAADHHPDITLTYPRVEVTLTSHDAGGVTERDIELARMISVIAAERGVPAGEAPSGGAPADDRA